MAHTEPKRVRLLVIEKEEIYRYMYEMISSKGLVDLLAVSAYSDLITIKHAIATYQPDVLLLGITKFEEDITGGLNQIREEYRGMAIVLLAKLYTTKDMEVLRGVAAKGRGGMAVFLKQSLDQIEQLLAIIRAASHGQIVLDPTLASAMFTVKSESSFLEQLTPRELEILGLLANGSTNVAIAEAMYIDVKTVERHLNNVYSKLKTEVDFDRKHPRVTATIHYLHEVAGPRGLA